MNVFRATRNHIHHRLLDLGFVHRESVIIIYSLQMVFVTSGVLLRHDSNFLLTGLYLGYCVVIFGTIKLAERAGWSVKRRVAVYNQVIRTRMDEKYSGGVAAQIYGDQYSSVPCGCQSAHYPGA